MLVLFMAAMAPGFVLYWVVLPRMKRPLVSGQFDESSKGSVDAPLVMARCSLDSAGLSADSVPGPAWSE